MEVEQTAGNAFWLLAGGGGMYCCMLALILLYNLIGAYNQSKVEDPSSGLAKASWALGFVSLFLGPCGGMLGLVAIVLSRIEMGKIYRDESPLGGTNACSMGSVNGGVALLLALVGFTLGIASAFM